jgi:hypothetical protein
MSSPPRRGQDAPGARVGADGDDRGAVCGQRGVGMTTVVGGVAHLGDPLEFRDILRSREFCRSGVGCGGYRNVEANGAGAWSNGEDPAAACAGGPA